MTEQRHKTVLEIAVDDRGVRQLGNSIKATLSTEPVERFNRAIADLLRRLQQVQSAGGAAGAPGGPAGRAPGRPPPPPPPRGPAPGGGAGEPAWAGKLLSAIEKMPGRTGVGAGVGAGAGVMAGNWLSRAGGMGAATMGGEGVTEHFLGGIPIVGQMMGAAVGAARRYAQEFVGYRQALGATVGATGFDPRGGANAGSLGRFGIMPGELPGRFAEIGRTSRMRGAGLEEFGTRAIATERTTCIGAGTIGHLAGAAGIGANETTPARASSLLENAIKTGMAAGFRIADLGDVLEDIASNTEELRSKGIMVTSESLMSIRAMLGATGRAGLQGAPGSAAAKSMEDVLRGAPERSDFGAALAMRLAMKGGRSPFAAMEALEQNASQLIPEFVKAITEMGGTEEGQAFSLRQAMQGRLGYHQARQLVQAGAAGELTPALAAQVAAGRASEYNAAVDAGKAGTGGAAATEAGLAEKRLAYGGTAVGDIQALQVQELELAKLGVKIGTNIADISAKGIELINIFTDKGMEGVVKKMLSWGGEGRRHTDAEPGEPLPATLLGRLTDFANGLERTTQIIEQINRGFGRMADFLLPDMTEDQKKLMRGTGAVVVPSGGNQ